MDLNKEKHRRGFVVPACQVCDPVPVYMLDPHTHPAGYVYPYQGSEEQMNKTGFEAELVKRGEIYDADLPEDEIGSVQEGKRPVLVTQGDWLNVSSPTVIVAMVTTKIKNSGMKTHVIIPMRKGLRGESMVMTEQRKTISKTQLLDYRCALTKSEMKKVKKACHASECDEDGHSQRRSRRRK
ncbi:mRNA-degrading endonuclease toxin of MazEF toxin-antitoxin module [Aminicella lysinilytica]|uniref:mRNA-degrading endonuclease toxin of MazEF toxin-antitoxin module n=2 Tax=Aminicella lysinilytica TaxID=433323 RepID=A0A4V3CQS5_9FIRM|nr:mRNA-degrading endonuclease toxin of MazEF toxin-antitoxin module [Aminicella lysinilytica]